MLRQLLLGSTLLITTGLAGWAQVTDDPLHGCIIGTSCADNGTVTPTTTNALPNFTFTISPGPNTGTDWLIDILIPNNAANAASLSFSISGTEGGSTNTSPIPATTAKLFSSTAWTNGALDAYLGLSASPNNPLSAWLGYTQGNNCGNAQNMTCDPGATGYYVYQADLGTNNLLKPGSGVEPILTLSGSNLPIASVITSFLDVAGSEIATAPSGGIFEADAPPVSSVPEPASVLLLGSMLFGAATLIRRKIRQA